jgi:hypothetical protein
VFVILTKRATRAAGRISDSFASEAGSGFEIAKRSFSDAIARAWRSHRMQNPEPEPAALAPRCPRSFLPLALLALSG